MTLDEAIRIIKARKFAVYAVLVVGLFAAAVGYKLSRPTYTATSTVLMNAGTVDGAGVSDGGFLGNDMPTLLLSETVLTRFMAQEHIKDEPLKNLRKAITADVTAQSAVMPITYKAGTAKAAIDGANALANDLRTYYREISTERYDDLARYLSTALDGERIKIEAADRQLGVLVAHDPYFTQNEAAQSIGAQLLALDQQRAQVDATMQSHAVQAQLAGTRMKDMWPTVQSELRSNDPGYSALSTEVAKDQAAETVMQSQFTAKYGGIKSLQDQIARSSQVLLNERKRAEAEDPGNSPTYGTMLRERDDANAIYAGDNAELAAIENQIESTESQLAKLPQVGVRIAALRRDRDAANTAYQILAEQRTLTLSQQAQTAALGSITVVDYASVGEKSFGAVALLVPVAAMLAFTILALALPFGLETIDQRLRRGTIESIYGRPLIGTVPA